MTKGDYDKAIADCNAAIRLDPKDTTGYLYRSIVNHVRGEYDKAIADCTESIRIDPKCVMTYYRRSMAYLAKGDYDKAAADCNEAIRPRQNSGGPTPAVPRSTRKSGSTTRRSLITPLPSG